MDTSEIPRPRCYTHLVVSIPRRYTHLVVYRCTRCGHRWYEGARRPLGYYSCILCHAAGTCIWYSDAGKEWAKLARHIVRDGVVPFESATEVTWIHNHRGSVAGVA